MTFSAEDYNNLSYLLRMNVINYDKAITWAYAQYTEIGVEPFIEKIALTSDSSEIRELISTEFQVYGEPSMEFLAGEVANKNYIGEKSLYDTIAYILFQLDLELPKEEKQELYIAEDYYGWHDSAESKAIIHAKPLLKKYRLLYEQAVMKFSV